MLLTIKLFKELFLIRKLSKSGYEDMLILKGGLFIYTLTNFESRAAIDVDMQKRWKYFLKTVKDDTLEFSAVIEEIQKFLEPVFDTILNESELQQKWQSQTDKWLNP